MKAFIATLLLILCADTLFAGESIALKCKNPKCRFEATLDSGGGFDFEQLSGYCLHCKKFVSISWDRKKRKPSGVTTVWVPQNFQLKDSVNLFPCPKCGQNVYSVFIDTNSKEALTCPKCFHETLHARALLIYD